MVTNTSVVYRWCVGDIYRLSIDKLLTISIDAGID